MLKHIHVPRFPFHTILSFVFCIISSFGCVFYSLQFWLLFFLHPPHSFCCILPIVFVAFFPDLAADFCCCIFARFVVAFSPDISHMGGVWYIIRQYLPYIPTIIFCQFSFFKLFKCQYLPYISKACSLVVAKFPKQKTNNICHISFIYFPKLLKLYLCQFFCQISLGFGFKLITPAKQMECQTVHQYTVSDQGCWGRRSRNAKKVEKNTLLSAPTWGPSSQRTS